MYLNKKIFCFLVLALLIGCIQTKSTVHQLVPDFSGDIPDSIIQKTNGFIKSKVGEQYFNSSIKFDAVRSHFRKSYRITHQNTCSELLNKPHYFLVYNIHIPDMGKDFVTIEFVTDTSGELIPECYLDKVPDCPNNNCWNYFPKIKKDEAIQIAMKSGLEKGLRDWKVSFEFYSQEFNNYVWAIKNYLSINNSNRNESRSGGEVIYISAIDGSVVQREHWAVLQ